MQIVARVQVGARPVHIYSVVGTVWSHSDAQGTFDVIALAKPTVLNTSSVPVSLATQS